MVYALFSVSLRSEFQKENRNGVMN